MQDGSTECQARDWGQDNLQEKDEGRRDRNVKMSTCHLRIVVGQGGALNIHPSQRQREFGYT